MTRVFSPLGEVDSISAAPHFDTKTLMSRDTTSHALFCNYCAGSINFALASTA